MRDNPIAMANADDGTGSNISPRTLTTKSGVSAIAATGAAVGDVLEVVNESNPGLNHDGSSQGGLLVRPVPKVPISDLLVWTAAVSADGTADTLALDTKMKTDGRICNCVTGGAGVVGTAPYTGGPLLYGNMAHGGDGSGGGAGEGYRDISVYRMEYVSGTNTVEITRTALQSGGDSPPTNTENLSIIADDTWRVILDGNWGGGDISQVLMKTDGDNVQFRVSMSGFGADEGIARVDIQASMV